MILVTIIGLYTSRVVFNQLGDINYGIYGVVGGILGFMSFLTTSMAGGTSRFITYEIGRGENQQINQIFNSALLIHCIIALVVIIAGETIGVWLLYNVLVIPPDRLNAAWWVLQFSVFSSAISITQVPYTALIMAYEKMDIYAYMEIINVTLKLIIVYLLSISPYDKLVVYAFLLFAVSTTMAFSYRLYCIKNFRVCKIKRPRNLSSVKSMLSFSTMDLYGNMGVTLNSQGLTYAINIFFGIVYNAAASLANTVNGIILSLTSTISVAFKPQIVKQYAQGYFSDMECVMTNSVKFTLISTAMFAIPCFLEADYILKLWLGEVPPYSVAFLRIIIIQSFFPIINNVCNSAIHATGNIKTLTFINGTLYMIMPIIIFIVYHIGIGVLWGYGIEIIGKIIITLIAIHIIKKLIPAFSRKAFVISFIKSFIIIIISSIITLAEYYTLDYGLIRVITEFVTYCVVSGLLSWFIILTPDNKKLILSKIQTIIRPSN